MAKRMIVMLTVTLLVVGGLGFVKFQQIQTAIAQGAAFQPPPEAVTTIVAQQEAVAGHAERDRHDGRRAGRDRERRPCQAPSSESCSIPARRCARETCWRCSTRGRSRRSSPRSRHSASWRVSRSNGCRDSSMSA